MKKFLFLATAILLCFSCSPEEVEQPKSKWESVILEIFTGHWRGEIYSSVTNMYEYEELIFTPFEKPKVYAGVFDGNAKITLYGRVSAEKYFNDHMLSSTAEYLYAIDDHDDDEYCTLVFYTYGGSDDNDDMFVLMREDKRILTPIDNNSFYMRSYGLTASNNKIYTRQ